ncbi:hypothetical protein L3X37_08940 [Sabulilitoribacter arenilitoris]|uniref:Uncharacterized protein n=1 Tax=Wocania arenilitoris TaxID=2044858 RepID=A0AAE3EP54_9FLAO|nr:hypothetical protein [Wocania arenilitoris]MCF7568488.1 hypothetical protein [Wocania arenilitoris]
MCFQCHKKTSESLEITSLDKLKKLYPIYKAIRYDINKVKGIWRISFTK